MAAVPPRASGVRQRMRAGELSAAAVCALDPAEVLAGMNQVAEGVPAAGAVCSLAASAGVEVPIATGVREVFERGTEPLEVWADLMARRARPEVG